MAKARGLGNRNLREGGWEALVTERGVTNAPRFVMECSEGEQDYAKPFGKLRVASAPPAYLPPER